MSKAKTLVAPAPKKRGRPVGTKVSQETKDKIAAKKRANAEADRLLREKFASQTEA